MIGLFACSGPGAAEAIATSELIGLMAFVLALVCVGAVLFLTRARRRWFATLAMLVHPGWWMSARSGDCGYLLRYAAPLATLVFAAAAAWAIWRSRVKLRST